MTLKHKFPPPDLYTIRRTVLIKFVCLFEVARFVAVIVVLVLLLLMVFACEERTRQQLEDQTDKQPNIHLRETRDEIWEWSRKTITSLPP